MKRKVVPIFKRVLKKIIIKKNAVTKKMNLSPLPVRQNKK